jgi:hypothetical protein
MQCFLLQFLQPSSLVWYRKEKIFHDEYIFVFIIFVKIYTTENKKINLLQVSNVGAEYDSVRSIWIHGALQVLFVY